MYEPVSVAYVWNWPSGVLLSLLTRMPSRSCASSRSQLRSHELDDVQAGTAELRLQLLHDLAVAADRAVQALQVAVDDEGQVVQALTGGDGQLAERLGLVHLAVAEVGPYVRLGGVGDAARLHVAVHPGLVDRAERTEAHRDGRELPEVRHQPRVRVAGQSVGGLGLLLAEGVELPLAQSVQEERAGVDTGRGVALEEDLVAAVALVLAPEEVVEAHVVEGGGGGEGGDVAADADARTLGARDHDGGVPPGRVEDLALDLLVAGEEGLVLGRDGVDVVRAAHLGHGHTLLAGPLDQPEHEIAGTFPASLVNGRVERVEPFLGLFGIEVRDLAGKAANDDRVSIGSGSHAVPSCSGRVVLCTLLMLCTGRMLSLPWCRAVFHRVPSHRDTSPLPMGNHPLRDGAEKADFSGRPNRNHTPMWKGPRVRTYGPRTEIRNGPVRPPKGPVARDYPINPAERCGVNHFSLSCWGRSCGETPPNVTVSAVWTAGYLRDPPGPCGLRPMLRARAGSPSISRNMTGGNP